MRTNTHSQRPSPQPAGWLHGGARYALLLFGDILIFYTTLILTLVLRYGYEGFESEVFFAHRYAFTIGLLLWLIIFYLGGLYDRLVVVRNILDRRFFALVGIGGLFLILMFYFMPSLGITPKTTLLIFIFVYAVVGYGWRMIFNALVRGAAGRGAVRIMMIGSSLAAGEICDAIANQPGYGYTIGYSLKDGLQTFQNPELFLKEIRDHNIDLLVIPQQLEHDPGAVRILYAALLNGTSISTLPDFYERLFEKVALSILDETWLIRNLADRRSRYQTLRRVSEISIAIILWLLASPILLLITLLIPLTSSGSVLYRQPRIGYDGKLFTLYKFRSMYSHKEKNPDADAGSAQWSSGNGDARVTPFGRFLRNTHLDELPQLFNIICGDMSFVGPRPERPEFTADLEKKIPYYTLRYLVRPGITGWAQLNYQYGASVDDAYQKLQYDIYYIKRRSLWLDMIIILKTIKRLFVEPD